MSGEEWEGVWVVSCGRVCGEWEEWGMVCDW